MFLGWSLRVGGLLFGAWTITVAAANLLFPATQWVVAACAGALGIAAGAGLVMLDAWSESLLEARFPSWPFVSLLVGAATLCAAVAIGSSFLLLVPSASLIMSIAGTLLASLVYIALLSVLAKVKRGGESDDALMMRASAWPARRESVIIKAYAPYAALLATISASGCRPAAAKSEELLSLDDRALCASVAVVNRAIAASEGSHPPFLRNVAQTPLATTSVPSVWCACSGT